MISSTVVFVVSPLVTILDYQYVTTWVDVQSVNVKHLDIVLLLHSKV